jgi:hypothetical protein
MTVRRDLTSSSAPVAAFGGMVSGLAWFRVWRSVRYVSVEDRYRQALSVVEVSMVKAVAERVEEHKRTLWTTDWEGRELPSRDQ